MLRFFQTISVFYLNLAARVLLIASPFILLAGLLAGYAAVGAGLLIAAVTAAFLIDQRARRLKHEQFLRLSSAGARLRSARRMRDHRHSKVNPSVDVARAQNAIAL